MMRDHKGRGPIFGDDCSQSYVDGYRRSHLVPDDVRYRLAYHKVALIDGLLRDYSLLDVGCGTAGYFRLMKNAAKFTGIDLSARMLEAAKELAAHFGYADRAHFALTDLPSFQTEEKFDVIRLGVYGSYEPFSDSTLRHAKSMLNPGGFLIARVAPAATPWQRLLGNLEKSNVNIGSRAFEQLACNEIGFETVLTTRVGQTEHYFLRSPDSSMK